VVTGGAVGTTTADEWEVVEEQWRRRDHAQLLAILTRSGPVGRWAGALRDTDLSADEVRGLPRGERGNGPTDPCPQGRAVTEAVAHLLELGDGPGHRATVAALVYVESLRAWESTDEMRQMRALAVALDRALALRPPVAAEIPLVEAIVELTWAVLDEVEVENGVFCSCPVAAAEHSERALARIGEAMRWLDAVEPAPEIDGLARVIRADAEVTRRYFEEVVQVCDATAEWIGDPESSRAVLDRAIEDAGAGVEALGDDVFASELNAHRVALGHMRAAAHRPRLRVDDGSIVYLYPFGLPESSPEQVVARFRADADLPETLGGLAVAPEVEPVGYGGTWQQEWCLGKHNQAVVLRLPELEIETTAATPLPGTPRALPDELTIVRGLRCEVRLSSLGIHVFRVEVPISDLEPHWLDQAMRRIGESIGREHIRPAGGGANVAPFLCRLADAVVDDLRDHVERLGLADGDGGRSGTVGRRVRQPGAREQDLLASAHVLLSVRGLSVVDAIGSRPCTPGEVAGALGSSVLLAPPRSLAAGFEWWTGSDVTEVDNVLAGQGLGDGLVVRTHGSTLVYAPDLPDWQAADIDGIAEHVATVSGALHAWGDHLGHYEVMVNADLVDVEHGRRGPEVIRERLRELARDASRVRAMLGQVRPVNLCRQASDRVLVERISAAAGLAEVERAVHDGLEVLSAQQARLAAEADRLRADADRREAEVDEQRAEAQERVQRRMDLWIAIIGLTSLMGFIDYVNRAVGWDGRPGVLLAECGLVVVVVAVTAGLFVRANHRARLGRTAVADDGGGADADG